MDDDVAWWVIPVIGDVQYNLVLGACGWEGNHRSGVMWSMADFTVPL